MSPHEKESVFLILFQLDILGKLISFHMFLGTETIKKHLLTFHRKQVNDPHTIHIQIWISNPL